MDFWVWWLIAAGGFSIALVLTAMPELGMLAIGAGAAAASGAVTDNIALQVIVFAVVSTALLVVVRPIARRARVLPPKLSSGVDGLKGRTAVVLERVDSRDGRIKLAGEEWSARALDNDITHEPGSEVSVVEIDGATAIVM
ncbi:MULTISPECIES: NfeD family protein [Streptomyces]|uniref:NfeD family protein n=2 Tax=Streptomyces TaxID=1883 RepID=A0ABV4ZUH0_9ACTN|nr:MULTISPECIES: NfeD family protein [Streptomyces]MCK1817255.1 NfeD family protein [Streptomyces sp. XM4011]QKV68117.1 NfeD family protein [Streptomyces harbinensis]UWM48432.1 NfeD family protein [Streptomyces carpaticus]